MRNLNIGTKAALVVAVCTVLGLLVAGVLIYRQAAAMLKEDAIAILRGEAQGQARNIGARFGEAVVVGRSLASAVEAISRDVPSESVEDAEGGEDFRRMRADQLLRSVLEPHTQFVGVAAGYEPDAFDGRDAEFVGSERHDDSGRYMAYWAHTPRGVEGDVLVDYETPGTGDYYLLPRTTGR